MSLNSYGRPASSITSIGSKDGRTLPPPLDVAKLPPLPPSRRELQEKARLEQKAKIPLVTVSFKSNFSIVFGFRNRWMCSQDLSDSQVEFIVSGVVIAVLSLAFKFYHSIVYN